MSSNPREVARLSSTMYVPVVTQTDRLIKVGRMKGVVET